MRPHNVRLHSHSVSLKEKRTPIRNGNHQKPSAANNQILYTKNKLNFNGNNQTLCSKLTKSSTTINETFHNNQSQLVREGADFGQGRGNGSDQSIRRQVQRPEFREGTQRARQRTRQAVSTEVQPLQVRQRRDKCREGARHLVPADVKRSAESQHNRRLLSCWGTKGSIATAAAYINCCTAVSCGGSVPVKWLPPRRR